MNPSIRHPIYKWEAEQRRNAQRPRANSFTAPDSEPVDSAFEHIREPGGFRRNYVMMRANEQGIDEPVVSNNFIEFLYLFGHFVSGPTYHTDFVSHSYIRPVKISKKKKTKMKLCYKRKVLWRGHRKVRLIYGGDSSSEIALRVVRQHRERKGSRTRENHFSLRRRGASSRP